MQVHESSVIIELFQEEAPKVCELDSLRGELLAFIRGRILCLACSYHCQRSTYNPSCIPLYVICIMKFIWSLSISELRPLPMLYYVGSVTKTQRMIHRQRIALQNRGQVW